ncbi:hypothetical protein A1342_19820 [Methylomonas methanica]|uniref:Uncharacterized protein n=1 Tax=Methylomonas denitrificans TaxID=1538553 RepID=A0A126T472_9GAMM|nr:hypothetical protein JT25_010360 [Methylomonas denitrificans]OAI09147.1 hypothetical protein A1342_19820 [Methylomonas methanica]
MVRKISRASSFLFENVVLLVAKKGYLVLGFNKPQDCLRKKNQSSKILTVADFYKQRILTWP